MRCSQCNLPDPYQGGGDGIGSCDCIRCDCCAAGPDGCECDRDYDHYEYDDDVPVDYLCNDASCPALKARLLATTADQTRDQAEAFLETLRRRSWADGDPLSDQALTEHVAAFQGDPDA